MGTDRELPREIIDYYERGRERDRLSSGAGLLEFLRTQQILRRALPAPPAKLLDVGGASGVHAVWLAREGYDVHLLDPVPLHVEQARNAAAAQPEHSFTADVADARRLPVADASVDVALLLGPLYHLVERDERLATLAEARRVLRPGGLLAAAAIGRFGDWLYGLHAELLDDRDFQEMAIKSTQTGQHRSVEGHWFTTAYYHRPEELNEECRDAGFDVAQVVAVEGVGPLLPDLDDRLADERRRRQLLDALAFTESEESMLGVTSHLLALARKAEEKE